MTPSDFAALQEGHIALKKQVAAVQSDLLNMSIELAANTEVTTDIREVLIAAKTGLKIIGQLGTFVKWAASIGAAVLAFVYSWHQMHK